MIKFRPLLGMSIASLITFGMLLLLGSWQVQRLHWKRDLIAQTENRLAGTPIKLEDALGTAGTLSDAQYVKVEAFGHFDHASEVFLFTSKGQAGVGFQVLTPLVMDSGRTVLVDRGFIPSKYKEASTREVGQTEGRVRVVGLIRTSITPARFTPKANRESGVWYSRDLEDIAEFLAISSPIPVFIDADDTPNPGGLPLGGKTIVTFPNSHLGYAITWFGLALSLLAVYIAYHVLNGRLEFAKRKRSE
jgi:surfeit locus 1 family protein